ncbi:MAG TPA: SPOR domain-containing protein [Candidatus Competibacter sp.]|nr:SPOR domain-containing protein [Candidatus Competibacter sp.]
MANANWKILSLLIVTFLVALGLQAGAIKIMVNLSRPADAPVAASDNRTSSTKQPVASAEATDAMAERRATVSEERGASDPAPAAREPKPTVLVSDPPHLANLAAKSEPSHDEPSPEAYRASAVVQPAASHLPPAAPSASVEVKPQPNIASRATGAQAAAASSSPTPAVASIDKPAAEPAESAEPAKPIIASNLQEPAWLKARDPKHYTVQLYSGKDIGTLKEIAAVTPSSEPQAYYSTGSRSGPWYSLVVGDYPDSDTARAAAAKLTAESPALKPWIRRFGEIQAKMH